jgi:hypothetical protein
MDEERLQTEIILRSARVGDLLRADVPPPARVSWSVAEVRAHIVSLLPRYRQMLQGPCPLPSSVAEETASFATPMAR